MAGSKGGIPVQAPILQSCRPVALDLTQERMGLLRAAALLTQTSAQHPHPALILEAERAYRAADLLSGSLPGSWEGRPQPCDSGVKPELHLQPQGYF